MSIIFNEEQVARLRQAARDLPTPEGYPTWKAWVHHFLRMDLNMFSDQLYLEVNVSAGAVETYGMCETVVRLTLVDGKNKQGLVNILGFTLNYYPHCCATFSLHGFSHASREDEAFLASLRGIFDSFMCAVGRELGRKDRNYRLHVMMVENMYGTPEHGAGKTRDPLHKPVGSANPKMKYRMYYDFFLKYGQVQQMLANNYNTGNVIHMMDVVLKPKLIEKAQ